MSFKQTCKKIRNYLKEDLNKDGPYSMNKSDVEFLSNDVKSFFSKVKANGIRIFAGGKDKANCSAETLKNHSKSR